MPVIGQVHGFNDISEPQRLQSSVTFFIWCFSAFLLCFLQLCRIWPCLVGSSCLFWGHGWSISFSLDGYCIYIITFVLIIHICLICVPAECTRTCQNNWWHQFQDALLSNWQSHWKDSKLVGFTQNNVGFIWQIMMHKRHQKLRHCLFVYY